jgi:hypothetical protein
MWYAGMGAMGFGWSILVIIRKSQTLTSLSVPAVATTVDLYLFQSQLNASIPPWPM